MKSSIVAAFDFDNTLTDRDSLVPFLFYTYGWLKTSYHLALLTPFFIGFLLGQISRQAVKEKILTRFFKGKALNELQVQAQSFADQQLDRYLKPEALQRLAWHQAQGHRCLLVSASIELYLQPWAQRHGFETAIGSRLEVTSKGKITGRLIGLNCWGAEKPRRLFAYLGPKDYDQLYVYGDSRGDQELLALANHPFYRIF